MHSAMYGLRNHLLHEIYDNTKGFLRYTWQLTVSGILI